LKKNVFTVLLKNLDPDTKYAFRITEPSWLDEEPEIFSYKTFDTDKIKIVDGGDVGNNYLTDQMNEKVVSKMDADLIMVGGDIAYDNNIPSCYRAWDYILIRMPYKRQDPATKTTRVIPFIFGVGNHDLGVNSFSESTIEHNSHEPVFKHYFPQHTDDGKIPLLKKRRSYFAHKIGDKLHIFSPDTEYESSMGGKQLLWMEKELNETDAQFKFAQYHGPIYAA
jgi:hypothetical protein